MLDLLRREHVGKFDPPSVFLQVQSFDRMGASLKPFYLVNITPALSNDAYIKEPHVVEAFESDGRCCKELNINKVVDAEQLAWVREQIASQLQPQPPSPSSRTRVRADILVPDFWQTIHRCSCCTCCCFHPCSGVWTILSMITCMLPCLYCCRCCCFKEYSATIVYPLKMSETEVWERWRTQLLSGVGDDVTVAANFKMVS
eukprot:gnl/Spiro4/21040_TR10266_c0_g1_i1.p1 gnl/Spiro4/21040_TR10266_c0_g1~~gnl/Spiro4/21040_TR10266_c0_g1_i1.p1  ORF type:complete len:201 (+),score=23.61 gnl/Spiro4/21040_TR10266_c0_g1_i1:52-654(+)